MPESRTHLVLHDKGAGIWYNMGSRNIPTVGGHLHVLDAQGLVGGDGYVCPGNFLRG